MKCRLSLSEKLRDLRCEFGHTLSELADITGIPTATLQRLESSDEIRTGYQDIVTLAQYYKVSMDYLTGITDNRKQRSTSIDELLLCDEAVAVLKSRKLNNRLIGELIAEPNFANLMQAVEIYIDRKLLPQISTMNGIYKLAETAIKENYSVSDDDEIISFLQEAVISEDDYLRFRITERFGSLMKQLFDKHKKDRLSDEQNETVKEMAEDLKYYLSDKSGADRAKLNLWAKKLGLNISDLSQEEVELFMKVINKSSVLKKAKRRK